MNREDIITYQKTREMFRKTTIGSLFYSYVSKQQRAERYDAQMEYTDRGSDKKLTQYWNEARAAEVALLTELYKIENLEYVNIR
jgi:hypothetical protein